eukprot:3571842-Amphidinium_carterae.1
MGWSGNFYGVLLRQLKFCENRRTWPELAPVSHPPDAGRPRAQNQRSGAHKHTDRKALEPLVLLCSSLFVLPP